MGARRNLPRPAPRQRPGPAYGSVLLGDPPSFDEDDSDPHCCVKPQRCSCRAVACGDRGVSCDMGRRPLIRRRWRHGSPFPVCQGMPPPAPRPPRSPRQFRLRSRTLLGPVVPRERSEGFTRLPHCRVWMSLTAVPCRPGASVSIRPRRLKCGDMAHPCQRVHLPMRSAILEHRASRGTWTSAAASYGCRARAGLPPAVCRPVCRASPPDNVAAGPQIDGVRLHPAPGRHQKRMFSSLAAAGRNADLAPRHYRDPARHCVQAASQARRSATTAGSDGARSHGCTVCISPQAMLQFPRMEQTPSD